MCSRLKRELSSELVESSSSSCLGNTVALVTFLVATKFSVVTLAAALAAGFFSSNENVEEGLTISSLVGDFDFFFFTSEAGAFSGDITNTDYINTPNQFKNKPCLCRAYLIHGLDKLDN